MVHKSSIIPGVSRFIDENILSQYPPNSMKRIILAGGVSLYLKQNQSVVESLTSNSLFAGLGVVTDTGMIDLDTIRDVLRSEVNKAGFMRLSIPMLGDIDFTPEDIDAMHKCITEANTQIKQTSSAPVVTTNNIGVY